MATRAPHNHHHIFCSILSAMFLPLFSDAPLHAADIAETNATHEYLASLRPIADKVATEQGKVEVTSEWTTVPVHDSYSEPIVVPYLLDDSDSALINVRSVSNDGFEIRVEACDLSEQETKAPILSYKVIESGYYITEQVKPLLAIAQFLWDECTRHNK
jgi:hypothetical protein